MQKLMAYLQLMRPANVVTAMADVMAGFLAAYWLIEQGAWYVALTQAKLFWLLLATSSLYAGGIVFNDVFDAKLDSLERPERPIPSGIIASKHAAVFGILLFIIGFSAAYQVSQASFSLALLIGALCFTYNGYAKHHSLLGPVNMGLCRAANLLLGIAAIPTALPILAGLSLVPLLFIAAITAISRGEIEGGNRQVLQFAAILYGLTLICALGFIAYLSTQVWPAIPFLLLFAWRVFKPLVAAMREPSSQLIRLAVKSGVTSLIVLDAVLGAGFANWPAGLLILSLLPISLLLAKRFAVT
jgi:4-hydroxybenzoate polyprenyltransferase